MLMKYKSQWFEGYATSNRLSLQAALEGINNKFISGVINITASYMNLTFLFTNLKCWTKKGWIQNTYREHLSNSTHKILPIHWKIQFHTMLNIYKHLEFWARLHFLNIPWTLTCNFAVNTNFHIQKTDYMTIEKFSRVSTGMLIKSSCFSL